MVAVYLKWLISRQYELDWGTADVLRSGTPQNRKYPIQAASLLISLQYSMERPCVCAYLTFEVDFGLDQLVSPSCAPVQSILPGNRQL